MRRSAEAAGGVRTIEAETLRAKEDDVEPRWRVGRTLGRTLYLDGHCVGMVDTVALATQIVDALNKSPSRCTNVTSGGMWAAVQCERSHGHTGAHEAHPSGPGGLLSWPNKE